MKKLISLILAALLVFSVTIAVAEEIPEIVTVHE